jgi:hypothetical protein
LKQKIVLGISRGEQVMLSEEEHEQIRRAYYIDHLKVSQIARETGHCRQTIQNVIEDVPANPIICERVAQARFLSPFTKGI